MRYELDYGLEDAARLAAARLTRANKQRADAITDAKAVATQLIRRGYTQEESARRLGVTRLTLRRWAQSA